MRSSFVLVFLVSSIVVAGCGDPPVEGDADVDASARLDGGATGCASAGCADPAAPHCDSATDRCVACLDASHCADDAAGVCIGGACRPCLTDTQCVEQLARPECRSDGRCVECSTSADCADLTPFCRPDGVCAECLDEGDCSDLAPACTSGSCRSCAEASCAPSQVLRELFALQCAVAIRGEGESDLNDAFEALFCSTRPELFLFFAYLEGAVEAGRIEIDEERFAECREASSIALFDEGACSAAMRGTVPNGGTCAIAAECVSGRCSVPGSTCAGTCVARTVAGEGCEDDDACMDGLICLSSVCQAPPGEGATCTTRCAEGLFCSASRVCEAQRAVGESCSGVASGGDCQENLACRSGRCAAPPVEGEACWPEYLQRCAEGLRCDGTVCRIPRSAGAACTSTVECAFGSRCLEEVCAPILGLGDPCTSDEPCALGTGCADGRCRPLPDLGEPCFAAGCLRGVCRAGTCQSEALFTACEPGVYPFDVLDPCGGTSSCSETPTGWQCVPEGGLGAACDGPADLPCRQPDLYCNTARACAAHCSP